MSRKVMGACFLGLVSMSSLAALATAGCDARRSSSGASGDTTSDTTRLVSPDGFIAVHFPNDFEPKTTSTPEGTSITLSGKTSDTHGTVSFVTKPKMGKLETLIQELHTPGADESGEKRRAATCAGKPGTEIRSTWKVQNIPFVKRRCYTVVNGHGYVFTYGILERLAPTHEAALRAIVDTTEFLR
jgi:hypothetical protein